MGQLALNVATRGLGGDNGEPISGSVICSSVRPVASRIDSHSSTRPCDFAVVYARGSEHISR